MQAVRVYCAVGIEFINIYYLKFVFQRVRETEPCTEPL